MLITIGFPAGPGENAVHEVVARTSSEDAVFQTSTSTLTATIPDDTHSLVIQRQHIPATPERAEWREQQQ